MWTYHGNAKHVPDYTSAGRADYKPVFLAQSLVQSANLQRFRPPFRDAENDKNSPDSTTDDRDDWAKQRGG
jgi:hypothetical protein